MKIEFLGYDSGDNLKAKIDGQDYKFATTESFVGKSVYGIGFPGDGFYSFISRSKKAQKFWEKVRIFVLSYMNENPF